MKYCEDCKWYKRSFLFGKYFSRCRMTPMYKGDKFISKKNTGDLQFATFARQYGPCDIEGKLWEEK